MKQPVNMNNMGNNQLTIACAQPRLLLKNQEQYTSIQVYNTPSQFVRNVKYK